MPFSKPIREEMQSMWLFIVDLLSSCGFERRDSS